MPRLIILAKNSSVRQVNITQSAITIGRASGCQVRIDSDSVSRHHATIQWEGGRFVLTDLSSRNGTFVNQQKIGNRPLANGDAILIGDCQIRFLESSKFLLPGEALRLLTMHGELSASGPRGRARAPAPRDRRLLAF